MKMFNTYILRLFEVSKIISQNGPKGDWLYFHMEQSWDEDNYTWARDRML